MAKKKAALGESYLDSVIPSKAAAAVESAPARPRRIRATFQIETELLEEARDAVVLLSGPPERLTLADLVENALRRELDRLRKKHTDGEPFPKRGAPVRMGRPVR